jgi:hypothetical protein
MTFVRKKGRSIFCLNCVSVMVANLKVSIAKNVLKNIFMLRQEPQFEFADAPEAAESKCFSALPPSPARPAAGGKPGRVLAPVFPAPSRLSPQMRSKRYGSATWSISSGKSSAGGGLATSFFRRRTTRGWTKFLVRFSRMTGQHWN